MLRLSRMTDYAVVVLHHMASLPEGNRNTADVVLATGLPAPTVSKLLHRLTEAGIVVAERGRYGGYRLDRAPEDVPLSEVLAIFEGDLALTDCLDTTGNACEHETHCAVVGRWDVVSTAIRHVLDDLTLADVLDPPALIAPPAPLAPSFNA
jgi:FeS assembly SUF system regulator